MATFAKDLVDLQQKGLINADGLTATSDNCIDAFVTGKAAMFSNGNVVPLQHPRKEPDMADNIGFAPYPAMMADGVPVVLVAEDSGYSIYADTPNKDAAIDFLTYLFSAENQKKYSEALGSPSAFTNVTADWAPASVVAGVNDAVKSATNIGFTNEKPAASPVTTQAARAGSAAGTYTPEEFAKAYEAAWNAGF
jgi:raffinose/stachyose/melibiose transport system substrate-binding protein